MKIYEATLKSLSPYSQSKHYSTPSLDKEGKDDYERRTWRDRMHSTPDGRVFIPAISFKNCLAEAAKYLSIQIPGKGKSTYTKHFEAGIIVPYDLVLPVKKDEVPANEWFVPADGIRGSGKRVLKFFPRIDSWEGTIQIFVVDETITKDVLERHLREAGNLIGVGSFRPRKNGMYGRFELVSLQESELKAA